MKTEMEDSNYESMISKLAKGSMEEKSASLKKLLFLYENARSRIYLYERRITECLELSLLIEEVALPPCSETSASTHSTSSKRSSPTPPQNQIS
jgi:hypothetical protein